MKKRYYYISEYTNDYSTHTSSLAQNTKVEYIISCFNQLGLHLHIISTAINKKRGFHFSKNIKSNNYDIHYVSSLTFDNAFLKRLAKVYIKIQLFLFALCRRKNDVVIIYHDVQYLFLLNFFKEKRKFNIIYEVEEIYSHAWEQSIEKTNYEINSIKYADAYIFVTEGLNEFVNIDKKPYIVAAGSYTSIPKTREKNNDGLIHCVYAGTFDKTKGGAYSAIASSRYLNNKYMLHILGFGTEKQTINIKKQIAEANEKTNCVVVYEGCLSGKDYYSFLQSCHIGLSTQNPNKIFNKTSFPSKITVYLANGLNVVSIYTDEIASFKGANEIEFYQNDSPQELANAIINSSKKLKDGRTVIDNLNKHFVADLKCLLEIM